MLKFNPENLIICDHHKTTIGNMASHPEFKPDGLIGDIDNLQSAAELAWKFFYPNIAVPLFVQYISFYDTWRQDLPDWEEHILPFNEGIKTLLGNFEGNKSSWLDLINWSLAYEGSEEFLAYANVMSDCLRFGRHIMKHKIEENNEIIRKDSFVTEFEGYKTLALNANVPNFMTSSPTWLTGEFDIALCFIYIGGNQNSWTCHLRTDKKDIDLEKIAKKYHGGGHFSSSGFQIEKLPFEFLIKKIKN
jgi:oligoribonuclease NrnB/cAMP/cGMP phosphodiesterase (DHH superfamily)